MTNRAPEVTAGDPSPALAIDELTTIRVPIDVRDPDGDAVTLSVSGCPAGQTTPVTLMNGALEFSPTRNCASTLTVTATDARGAAAQASVSYSHTSLRGWYRLVVGDRFYDSPFFFANMEQTGAIITGTIRDIRGHEGQVDPHEPGTIDAAGRFRVRFKIQSEGDLLVAGQVISADLSVFNDVVVATGVVIDGLYAGRAFQLWREAQF